MTRKKDGDIVLLSTAALRSVMADGGLAGEDLISTNTQGDPERHDNVPSAKSLNVTVGNQE